MKLYLTAFNQTRFASRSDVAARIRADLKQWRDLVKANNITLN